MLRRGVGLAGDVIVGEPLPERLGLLRRTPLGPRDGFDGLIAQLGGMP